jgi:hypothetical protein
METASSSHGFAALGAADPILDVAGTLFHVLVPARLTRPELCVGAAGFGTAPHCFLLGPPRGAALLPAGPWLGVGPQPAAGAGASFAARGAEDWFQ